MKIVWVINGGVDKSAVEKVIPVFLGLIKRLSQHCELTVIALAQTKEYCEYDLLGARVICLGNGLGKAQRIIHFWRATQLSRRLKKPDMVHAFGLGAPGSVALLLSKLWKVPLMVSLMGGEMVGFPEIGYGGQLNWYSRWVIAFVLRQATLVNAGSAASTHVLQKFRLDATQLPLGTEPTSDFAIKARAKTWRLLHLSDINPVKNQMLLLETLRELLARGLDVRLDWAGFDTFNGVLQAKAKELGVAHAMHYHGWLPHSKALSLCQDADVLLVTSRWENQCMVVLEAAMRGLPTVGTNVGILAQLAPDAAVTCTASSAAMADAVQNLLESETQYVSIAQAARTWALEHDADWTTSRLLEMYALSSAAL